MEKTDKFILGNAKIAKFMGGVVVGSFTNNLGTLEKPNVVHDHDLYDMGKNRTQNECYWAHTTMKYHKDWNWLMPVLSKIGATCPVLIKTELNDGNYFIYDMFRFDLFHTTIETAWLAAINYIDWYNKQKPLADSNV